MQKEDQNIAAKRDRASVKIIHSTHKEFQENLTRGLGLQSTKTLDPRDDALRSSESKGYSFLPQKSSKHLNSGGAQNYFLNSNLSHQHPKGDSQRISRGKEHYMDSSGAIVPSSASGRMRETQYIYSVTAKDLHVETISMHQRVDSLFESADKHARNQHGQDRSSLPINQEQMKIKVNNSTMQNPRREVTTNDSPSLGPFGSEEKQMLFNSNY